MKKDKTKIPPKWIIKSFEEGQEDGDLAFWVVSIIAFYILGIIWCLRLLGLIVTIIFVVITLPLLVKVTRWLSSEIELLKNLRKNLRENSKSKEEK